MNELKIKNNTIISLMIILIIFIMSFIFIDNVYFTILLLLFSFIFIMSLKDYDEHPFFVCYLIAFFIFLLGKPFVVEVFNYTRLSTITYDIDTKNMTYIYLSISLISLYLGFLILTKFKIKNHNIKSTKKNDKVFVNYLLKFSKKLSILLYSLAIVENILRYIFIKDVGYMNSYVLEATYKLPYGLHYLVEIAPIAFSLFLGCFPSKNELKIPMILFLISNIILALSGNRFEIVSSFLLIIVYFLTRNKIDNEVWIKKKNIVTIVLLAPIIILVLQLMIYWRSDSNIRNIDNPYFSFLYGVGESADLISATQKYSDVALSDDVIYSFGNLWRGFHANIVAKIFGVNVVYRNQTIDMAKKGHSLSAALTYVQYPKKYVQGYGLGGCYIAELLHDFSILGIIVGNIAIGMVIGYFSKIKKGKFFYNFCFIFSIPLFLRLPRDSFDYVLAEFIGIKNILACVLIIFLAKQITIKHKNDINLVND